ncbi:hypothetical protein [Brevibacterium luteolum]|uniref:DUF1983 domain-containing protein n=1 Tax=Brevibacterium luteolum TaxID=199591 RepID=A0A849AKS6_9MICO|nr:hypothetical protein [Brevibacterium luteolum]MBM7530452.1 hypothetical protein [Brevibacterium luteolum]NNG77848.1 hypothetical protein [Brevibacterium luteolum]
MSQLARLIREIDQLKAQLAAATSTPQLAHSAIEGGSIDSYDHAGNLRLRIGDQGDGTQTIRVVDGPVPPAPSAPVVAVDGPVLTIKWDGHLADPNLPLPADFARIHVHLAQTPDMSSAPVRASIEAKAGASTVTAVETAGTWWVALAVEAQSGKRSPLSAPVEAVVSLVNLDGALEAVRESADGKNRNHYNPIEPSPTDHELAQGDLWFDTSEDGQNLPHRWDGESWVSVGDQRVEAVRSAMESMRGELEQVIVDSSGSKVFYQPTRPSAADASVDDLWFDTSAEGKNVPHRWDGTRWVSVADQRVEAVRTAMESMRGDLEGQIEGAAGNRITWSPATPPTGAAPGKSGDTWFQIQAGRVTGQWAHDGSSWVARPISHEVIASLDLGKATVGELDGGRIRAGSVTADRLLVGAGSNILPLSGLPNGIPPGRILNNAEVAAFSGRQGAYGQGFRVRQNPATASSEWTDVFTFCRMSKTNSFAAGDYFPVTPGEEYVFSAKFGLGGAYVGPTPEARIVFYVYTHDTKYVMGASSPVAQPAWNGVPVEHSFVVPATAAWMQVYVRTNQAGWVEIAEPSLQLKVGATLISDGAVTTEKIAAGAITAESGVIGSLDLGKATVGELDGARIKAGSVLADAVLVPGSAGSTVIADGAVTTEKLAAGAITAESGVIGSLDLGKATVGELDGARIKFGSASGDILKADALDGKVITGAVVQTSHDHPKTLLDPAGVHVTDEDGQDVVYLGRQIGVRGPSGETLAQISDDGEISGRALNIEEDPVYAGLPLLGAYQAYERPSRDGYTGWLDSLPRGVVARGRLNPDINVNRGVSNGVIGLMELQFQQEAGRQFKITVEPITVFVFDGGSARLVVRYTWDGSQPNSTSSNLADWQVRSSGGAPKFSLGGSFPYEGESTTIIRLLLCLETDKTVKLDDRSWSTRGRMLVEDIGPIVEDTTVDRLLKVENSVSSPEPPAPEKRNYTKRYWATAGRAFYTRGGYRTSNTDLVYQGDQPGMGGMRSAILFPSMTGDLSGAEITSMTMRIDFTHWYYSAGGDAQIQLHGLSSLPTSMPSMEHGWTEKKIPKPGQRVVKIPSRYWSRFKSGNVRGIGIGDTSPSRSEYGHGRWARYYIEVKYRK